MVSLLKVFGDRSRPKSSQQPLLYMCAISRQIFPQPSAIFSLGYISHLCILAQLARTSKRVVGLHPVLNSHALQRGLWFYTLYWIPTDITQEHLRKLPDPFQRVAQTQQRKGSGHVRLVWEMLLISATSNNDVFAQWQLLVCLYWVQRWNFWPPVRAANNSTGFGRGCWSTFNTGFTVVL